MLLNAARNLILAPMLLTVAMTSAHADSNLFFYNKDNGAGAVTTFSRTQQPGPVSAQEFSSGWNVLTAGSDLGVLFYNGQSGHAVEAGANLSGVFSDYHSYNFSAGWTQIVDVTPAPGQTGATLLFYNRLTGLAVTGTIANGPFAQYPSALHFSAGWTNIVATDGGMLLFYNAANGSGAVGYLEDVPDPTCDPLQCGPIDKKFVQKTSYAAGALTVGWSSIVETHNGILFYRSSDGLLVMADVNSKTGALTTRAQSLQHLSAGWSSIAADPSNILFYNKDTGSAAIGHIVTRSPQVILSLVGSLTIDQTLPNLFSTGWTSVTNVVLEAPPAPAK